MVKFDIMFNSFLKKLKIGRFSLDSFWLIYQSVGVGREVNLVGTFVAAEVLAAVVLYHRERFVCLSCSAKVGF